MDDVARAFYDMEFKAAFREKKATAFQDFFSDIMEKRHFGDFVRVQPKGRHGDWKCDGFLRSEAALFQCYAPNELKTKDTLSKISKDFRGARTHWTDHLQKWVFVHNAKDGLGPAILEKLLTLDKENDSVKIEHWGYEELRQRALGLSEADLVVLFGHAPTRPIMTALGLEDLAPILDQLERLSPPSEVDLRPVPASKLEYNALSDDAGTLLKAGMQKSPLVRRYFNRTPELQDKIAKSFHEQYQRARDAESNPDEVFRALQQHAGGAQLLLPGRQAAVLACLAFFFEECDIFDRPPEAP